MSDCDDSFDDSFDSGSESDHDHVDGPSRGGGGMAGEDGFMILRGAKAADGVSGGGLLDPAAMMRKDLLLVNSGGESVTDHEDWR